ncbi:unnamed protein product [Fusarium equiseti]|uniref:Uncharacterized protein n=1 Tax=Fusarium equiseti TaxID=61235 RepID=A0A8J2N9H9_FUSEQ|nr:unnamed protein product [Fusarium equiseti]
MSDNPYMSLDWLPGQYYEWYQPNTWGADENAFIDAQELNVMDSLHPSQFHASFSNQAPLPDLGNGQTHAEAIYHPHAFQEHANTAEDNNQGELALVPCVVCTKRMAKFKPNDQGTKACSSCSKSGRGCIWIEESSRLGDLAMKVQWAYQRVKDHGGYYTREDKQHCKWFLEELEQMYPAKGGSKRRR